MRSKVHPGGGATRQLQDIFWLWRGFIYSKTFFAEPPLPTSVFGPGGELGLKNPIYTAIPVTPPGAGWWHLVPPSCQLMAPTAINPAYSG
jgi:hypothetical protein